MLIRLLTRKPKVVFVYSERYRYSGSTVMRGEQLCDIAKNKLSGYHFAFLPVEQQFKNSVLFMTKGAMVSLTPEKLAAIKKAGNRVLLDPVDVGSADDIINLTDGVVAASRLAYEAYKKSYPGKLVALIDHHADPRIKEQDFSKQPKKFKAAYFGEVVNSIRSENIEKLVDFVQVDTFRQENSWLRKLPKYNFHYAVRNNRETETYKFKPFTKGFIAATCNSNILIQSSEEEAVLWLGGDYPYLLEDPVNEGKIVEAMKTAKESYGSPQWRHGLEIMKDIKNKVSEDSIAKQLNEVLQELI